MKCIRNNVRLAALPGLVAAAPGRVVVPGTGIVAGATSSFGNDATSLTIGANAS